MFESSSPFALFDYFRVPYVVRPAQDAAGPPGSAAVHWLRAVQQPGRAGRSLLWPGPGARRSGRAALVRLGRYQLAGCTFFGHVATDIPEQVRSIGSAWRAAEQVSDAEGRQVAAVWRDRDGSIFLPFDPGEVMLQFWSEGYLNVGRSSLAAAQADPAPLLLSRAAGAAPGGPGQAPAGVHPRAGPLFLPRVARGRQSPQPLPLAARGGR